MNVISCVLNIIQSVLKVYHAIYKPVCVQGAGLNCDAVRKGAGLSGL